ncbi:hypothetical protein LXL04_008635 [Taraxacum kok-saghyz]
MASEACFDTKTVSNTKHLFLRFHTGYSESKALRILAFSNFDFSQALRFLKLPVSNSDFIPVSNFIQKNYAESTKNDFNLREKSNSPFVFTIYGLWPDYNDVSWPSCCSGPAFNETEISTSRGVLE